MIPKFIMANGKLVKMLLHTKVTKYLEWKCLDGSYVAQYQKGGMLKSAKLVIAKVPANDMEALKSNLMGMFEKKRLMNFYKYIENVDMEDKKTWKDLDLETATMNDVFGKYKLDGQTIDFLGHAVALYIDDDYLTQSCKPTIEKMTLYLDSIGRYGDSPFLYPIYGLGGLPEAFSRLCAIHGGTYMLNTQVDEILMDGDKVVGIKSGDQTATAPLVICDPSYVMKDGGDSQYVKPIGKVIRAICLMNHPIPHTNNAQSIQIILPAKQLNKKTGKSTKRLLKNTALVIGSRIFCFSACQLNCLSAFRAFDLIF